MAGFCSLYNDCATSELLVMGYDFSDTFYMFDHEAVSDTSPEAEAVLLSLLRQAPPWRKFKMVGDLNATVKQFALAGIRQQQISQFASPPQRRQLAMSSF